MCFYESHGGQWWATKTRAGNAALHWMNQNHWARWFLFIFKTFFKPNMGKQSPTTDWWLHSSQGNYSGWAQHLCGMTYCTTAPSTTCLLLNWLFLSTTGQPFSSPKHEMSYNCNHDPSEQEFTTASVLSFNCFSPRCGGTESEQRHAKRQHWDKSRPEKKSERTVLTQTVN